MRQSNSYTLIFTGIVTIILGFLLSIAATSLKEKQELNVAIDIKKNILRSLDFSETQDEPWTIEIIQEMFDKNIISYVVDGAGEKVDGMKVEDIDPLTQGNLSPVFCKKGKGKDVEGYAVPISGKGLWSTLYGYFALEADGITVKGITFYKHGETPGLGGEVEKEWFTHNFIGKRIIDGQGNLVGIQVVKGQVDELSENAFHQVDGISGATMTSKGLNNFLMTDLQKYEPFFKRIRTKGNS
jgi:Na+-transporting NADH:ubiquinone oxidoreductase subunit C